jgi:SAM-dependent methyltransferase
MAIGSDVERGSVRWVEGEFPFHAGSEDGEPFDVVLFTRSLHHMAPLGRTLDRAAELLRPRGLLVGEEFAFDRVTLPTARWWFDLEAVLVAAGILAAPDPALRSVRNPLGRWRQEHSHDPPLASGHDMLSAVRERFETAPAEEAPYLYRYVFDRTTAPGDLVARVGGAVHEIESRLIRERDIAAAGLRLIGTRPP